MVTASCRTWACHCRFSRRLVSVLVQRELLLVIVQLAQQAFAEIAATYARRIELANHLEGFLQIGKRKTGGVDRVRRGRRLSRSTGSSAEAAATAESPFREPKEISAGELAACRSYIS